LRYKKYHETITKSKIKPETGHVWKLKQH